MREIWKKASGFPAYSVSNLGNVRRDTGRTAGRNLSPARGSNGYLHVTLSHDTVRVTVSVHQLVCAAFHGPRPDGAEVRHLNGCNMDNCPENLCWGTARENSADRVAHGRQPRGTMVKNAKLTPDLVRRIRGQVGGKSYKQMAREFGVSDQAVYHVVHGKTWRHVQ